MSELATQQSATEFKSIYEVDLNVSNVEELFDDSSSYVPQALQAAPKQYDPTWKAHRTVRFNKDRVEWRLPISSKEIEEGKKPITEVFPTPDHHFIAIRGIPLGFQYGFRMNEGSDGESRTVCYTTKVEELLGENSRTIEDRYPLEVPIKRVNKKKDEPNTPNPWFLNNQHIRLYGSRPPVGHPEGAAFNTPRTCVECVMAGEHYIGTEEQFKDPSANIPTCRMDGYLLFAVFELGVMDASEMLHNPVDGRINVVWKKVADANLTTEINGKRVPLDRPFILKIQGMTLAQHSSIGTGKYDMDVLLPKDTNQSSLPTEGELLSAGDYYNYINDPNYFGVRSRKLKGNKLGYLQVTEIHVGKLRKTRYNSDYIPVFHPVTDPQVIDAGQGWTPAHWLQQALNAVQFERALVLGNVIPDEALPAAAKQEAIAPAAEPAPTATKKTTKEKVQETATEDAWEDQRLEAFKA